MEPNPQTLCSRNMNFSSTSALFHLYRRLMRGQDQPRRRKNHMRVCHRVVFVFLEREQTPKNSDYLPEMSRPRGPRTQESTSTVHSDSFGSSGYLGSDRYLLCTGSRYIRVTSCGALSGIRPLPRSQHISGSSREH